MCAGLAAASVSAARAQEPDIMEIPQEKAKLAASLFGDDSGGSFARPAGRRTPQKQVLPFFFYTHHITRHVALRSKPC